MRKHRTILPAVMPDHPKGVQFQVRQGDGQIGLVHCLRIIRHEVNSDRHRFVQVICQDLRLSALGNVLLGFGMLAWAILRGNIAWTLGRALTLAAMVLCGALLFFAVFLIYATLCFFTLEGLEILNIFTDGVKEHGRYPFDVYGKGVLWFLTALLPFALVQYWPLEYLMGRGPGWYGLLPLVSLWFLIPTYALWRFGVRRYRSAGS